MVERSHSELPVLELLQHEILHERVIAESPGHEDVPRPLHHQGVVRRDRRMVAARLQQTPGDIFLLEIT